MPNYDVSRFEVWAPLAKTVELVLAPDTRMAMAKGEDGLWSLRVESAKAGTRYAFSIDGGPPRPDPRSSSQPQGVHAFSELSNLREFAWTDQHWRGLPLRGGVIYELHVGTFTAEGTFASAIKRLPHLHSLGVDAVEVMPVSAFPGQRGWGYDGVAHYAPHAAYGGARGLMAFVDACHALGMGVILDVVYNHLGPSGNYLAEFGPYFDAARQTNWGSALNFDGPHSDGVRRYFIDNALYYLREFHLDGLRLDATHAIEDRSAVHVLEQLAREVDELSLHLRRPLHLIAEDDRNAPRLLRSRSQGGYGLSACWADEWHHALHALLTGERTGYYEDFGGMPEVLKALTQAWVFDGVYSPHRKRTHGASPAGLAKSQLVTFTQNHDHIGNRARGERLCHLISHGRAKVAATLLLTGPFTPLIFQGEEWAASSPFQYFTDHQEPELGKAVSEGRKREFSAFNWKDDDIPDPQAESTFQRSKLDWSERERAGHDDMLRYYRKLIQLRRAFTELTQPGSVKAEADEASGLLCVERGRLSVIANLSSSPRPVTVPAGTRLLLASDAGAALGSSALTLPAESAAVVQRRAASIPVTLPQTPPHNTRKPS